MNDNDIFKRVCSIIANVLGVDEDEITQETTFDDDLGADSLDIAQIVMDIEDEFDIHVDENEITKITTVGEAVEMIEKAEEGTK